MAVAAASALHAAEGLAPPSGGQQASAAACPLQAPDGGLVPLVAWTSVFNSQPHHVASPFTADLVPPITMLGICEQQQWDSTNWKPVGMRGGDWIAKPTTAAPVQFVQGAGKCAQRLSALSVMTAVEEHSALRLHFEGCELPPSVIALRLTTESGPSTGTGEPTVSDLGILDFLCSVSPEECQAARARIADAGGPSNGQGGLHTINGRLGAGKCTGYGSQPHDVSAAAVADKAACTAVCKLRIEKNMEDPGQGFCTGYAWNDATKSCFVYDQWPVTDSDKADGYMCYTMKAEKVPATPVAASTQAATTTPPPLATGPKFLDLAKIFMDPRAVTARRLQVSSFTPGCFPKFDWYIIDRWVHMPEDKYQVLLEMTKANTSDVRYLASDPAHNGTAPRTNLQVERACIRDCVGALRAECKALDDQGVPPGYELAADGSLAPIRVQVEEEPSGFNLTDLMETYMGEPATRAFTDSDYLTWSPYLSLGTLVLGAILSYVVGPLRRGPLAPQQHYQSVEEVKLIYEGDEEETVALRSNTDTSTMSVVTGHGIQASWTPTKARTTGTPGSSKRNIAWTR